ncbi:MATE family efflux transporter [Cellulomonas chengniuliangii]|uniref:MATE family efflux transporter n=1 Tax=Cellulomonas chengniuliangii TaxID=2968084 RepID=A0ABY5L038_9CELL|nr:MATE family efflux transporter [Cellulomonas chengniuliangii]MCC2307964.1 MATE family efflux transporter [Cellulomonas chengniuliangii]MCC2318484.1 MATE family efflux transporter [Cellulomonas chengniuliangii]UUI75288.1 MATE family efflux transporter [Cellulomonas chengniuliangii]
MSKTLTTGRPWRVILAFSIPLLVGNVVQQLYQVVDAIVVGRVLGVDALAAVGATGSFIFLLLGFAWGLTNGFAIPTAQAFGAGDAAAVRRSVAAGAVLTAGTSVVLTVLAPLLAGPALRLLRTPEELVPQATTFAVISFLGASTMMFFNFLAAIIRAIGDSRTPLMFLAISCLLNIGLVLLFVGSLGLGVGGAAWATVVSQGVSVVLCLVYVRRSVPVLHVRREDWRVSRADLALHLRIGLPMGFQASIIAIGAIAVQVRLNDLGSSAVAAYTAATRVDGLAVALLASLGLAVSMFVAQNHGAQRPDRIRQGVVQGVWISLIGAVVLAAVLIAAGSPIIRLFVGEGEERVVSAATTYLVVNGSLYVVLGVLFVLRGALQGLGHTVIPTITGVIELVMRVGAAIVLGAAFGFTGVVWGNPLAWIGAVAILIPAYLRARSHLGDAHEPPEDVVSDVLVLEGPIEGSAVVEAVIPTQMGLRDAADSADAPLAQR